MCEGYVPVETCNLNTKKILDEIAGLRDDVATERKETRETWGKISKVYDTIFVGNGKKSVMQQIDWLTSKVTAPKYADLSWVKIVKIMCVRSSWAAFGFLSILVLSPAGQSLVAAIKSKYLGG